MENQSNIQCPNCGNLIDVNDVLKHQLEDSIRKEFQQQSIEKDKQLEAKFNTLQKEKEDFEAKKKDENNIFLERLEKEKKAAEKEITAKLKSKIEEENKDRLQDMEKELSEKSEKIRELNKIQGEISKLQREKSEMKEELEAAAQKKIFEQVNLEKKKIKKQIEESNELKFATLHKQLEDQKN